MVPYVSKAIIADRLPAIFPEGTKNRSNCISDVAASAIFVLRVTDEVEREILKAWGRSHGA